MSLKFIILLSAVATCAFASECKVAPRFWCDSFSMAKKCGVLSACANRLFPMASDAPVQVDVYFESLCPDSIRFITTMLYPTWEKLESTGIMNVKIVPFGKAFYVKQDDGSYKFSCQHGKKECYGNSIENCLIKYSDNNPHSYLPIVQCMESASDPVAAANKCITDGGYSWDTINTCALGPEGNDLLHTAGVETKALEPKLNWVPWIVINGVHSDEIQSAATNDLLSLICETYQGEKPSECTPSTVSVADQKVMYSPEA
uniref:Gamma-interferon-inducible lysosomal thiol reductase n=1 Tax=Phallusia mammillata TaxID=59560 RepID=A0A6F9DEB3_9ASCI|nr:gamma-interferon-inducible lysosomal thiol reductase [Phallusia mammillata]